MSKAVVKAVEKSKRDRGIQPTGGMSGASSGRQSAEELGIRVAELDSKVLRRNLILKGDELESATMAYNLLRTQVYRTLSSKGINNIGITSSHKGEGKSLTAINFAMSLARSIPQDVILVDLDLRRPSIDKKLSIDPGTGMGDYFSNKASLLDVIFNPGISGLYIAPGKGSLDNASELLSSGKMRQLQTELSRLFPAHFVVYDLPPVLLVDDVMVVSEYLDSMILVATEGETKKEELSRAVTMLDHHNLLGVVLNKSEDGLNGGYYDYYYGEK